MGMCKGGHVHAFLVCNFVKAFDSSEFSVVKLSLKCLVHAKSLFFLVSANLAPKACFAAGPQPLYSMTAILACSKIFVNG